MAVGKQNNHRDKLVRISEVSNLAVEFLEMAKLQLTDKEGQAETAPALDALGKQLSRIIDLSNVE